MPQKQQFLFEFYAVPCVVVKYISVFNALGIKMLLKTSCSKHLLLLCLRTSAFHNRKNKIKVRTLSKLGLQSHFSIVKLNNFFRNGQT